MFIDRKAGGNHRIIKQLKSRGTKSNCFMYIYINGIKSALSFFFDLRSDLTHTLIIFIYQTIYE